MSTLENTSLFTDLTCEESFDINGGDAALNQVSLAGIASSIGNFIVLGAFAIPLPVRLGILEENLKNVVKVLPLPPFM